VQNNNGQLKKPTASIHRIPSRINGKIRLPNGISLDCRESGDLQGEPVILLHGVTDSHHAWRPFIEELPKGLHVYALSMRGHGDSDKPLESYDASAFAGDLAAFMDAVDLKRAHICAHSMGTWIAQRFATDYPTRVISLSLIGGFITLRGNPAVASMPADLLDMGPVIDPGYAGQFQRATLAREVEPDFLEMVVGESLKASAHVWRACFDAMLATPAKALRIPHPTLLLAGEKDAFFGRKDRRALMTRFKTAEQIVYEDLGHAPHWEAPHFVAGDIARFIVDVAALRLLPARAM
jgi:pimeloyl-ACP methyl ester carboxylesterase